MNPPNPPLSNDFLDDDRTQVRAAPSRGPVASAAELAVGELPPGTTIRGFEIISVIAAGGFGIVYDAYERSLDRRVALKEYMPSSLASRVGPRTVAVRAERHAETFDAGLRSFINEARLLAKFDHPSLAKVHQFWEENGTAYMVMPLYQGITLKDRLRRAPFDEAWLKELLGRLLEALEVLHDDHCYHRDIAPDNIILLADGTPVLLDFGAARQVIGDRTQALSVILKPGYAPIEQYAEVPTLKQGAWTDIYALGAVMYYAITGRPPETSVGRMVSDTMVPLAEQAQGKYSADFLTAIDRCLAVHPQGRPQSIQEFIALLKTTPDAHAALELVLPASPAVAKPLAGGGASPPVPKKASSLPAIAAIGLASLAVVGTAAYFFMTSDTTPIAAPSDPIASAKPEPPPIVITPPPPTPPAPPPPFSPIAMFDEILAARSPGHAVNVDVPQPQSKIGKDPIRFTVTSTKPGHLYILTFGTSRDFVLLFPSKFDGNNRIADGKPLTLPRPHWEMQAEGPEGTSEFIAIVSEHPLDFTSAGATPSRAVPQILEFPLDDAEKRHRAHNQTRPLFAGTVICPAGQPTCATNYGAARFGIQEIR